MAGREAHQVDQRHPGLVDRGAVREGRLEPGDRVAIARALDERPVVDQLAQRADRRVLVRDAGEEQFLEAMDGRFGVRALPRELLAEPVKQAARIGAEARFQVGERGSRMAPGRRSAS